MKEYPKGYNNYQKKIKDNVDNIKTLMHKYEYRLIELNKELELFISAINIIWIITKKVELKNKYQHDLNYN